MSNSKNKKIVLITGSTDGIGKLTSLKLAEQNMSVLIHGRDIEKTQNVVREIISKSGNQNIKGFTADFSSLEEVRQLADQILIEYPELNILN